MKRIRFSIVLMVACVPMVAWAQLPAPARVGGTLSVEGTPLSNADFQELSVRLLDPEDGSILVESTLLNLQDWYVLDIPVQEPTTQPEGYPPGTELRIEVLLNGFSRDVLEPAGRTIVVGVSGSLAQVDLNVARANIFVELDGASPLGDGWYESEWFGFFNSVQYPWLFHDEHSYIFISGEVPSEFYYYDLAIGAWFFSGNAIYPSVYKFGTDADWYFFVAGTKSPDRQFYNLSTGALVNEADWVEGAQ